MVRLVPDPLYSTLDLNIDRWLNPIIPRNNLHILPRPISHFLGCRKAPSQDPPALIQWILTAVATVAGICLVSAVYTHAPGVKAWHPPPILASLGASAVLDYNAIRSPLAQPRNAVFGHTIAAVVAVAIGKLFMKAPSFFMEYNWVAGAVACAGATLVMSMTNTVHPPGGATAVLACTDMKIVALGWKFPPLVLLGSVLMLSTSCLFNNTLRQYPMFWWTPDECGSKLPGRKSKRVENDEVKTLEGSDSDIEATGDLKPPTAMRNEDKDDVNSEKTLAREFNHEIEFLEGLEAIHIAPYMIRMPPRLDLTDSEVESLQRLMIKLRTHMEVN